MQNKIIFSFLFLLILNACGLGERGFELPQKRPSGLIQGNVLGGLYVGGTVSVYTLNDANARQFLASADIDENGNFSVDLAVKTQAIIIEARSGTYLDPIEQQNVNAEPVFILTNSMMYQSGQTYNIPITPLTHLSTGLTLFRNTSNSAIVDEVFMQSSANKINELYSIDINDTDLRIFIPENSNQISIEGSRSYGLLISALAQFAYQERRQKDEVLKNQFNLSSLTSLMYEDIRADGVLDGKSVYENDGGIKTLAFGNQLIDSDFYRLKTSLAMQASLALMTFSSSDERSAQEDFILVVAQSESELLDGAENNNLQNITPEITLVSNLASVDTAELSIIFTVENTLKLQTIILQVGEIEQVNSAETLYDFSRDVYAVPLSTTTFEDGTHEINIIVKDTFNNAGSLPVSLEITFDNSPPELTVLSANLTNQNEFLLFGNVADRFSVVQSVAINGENAELLENNQWQKMVMLQSEENEFQITASDTLGNSTKINTQVFFDESAPVVTVTSAGVTNIAQFTVTGTYSDAQSNVTAITVNGIAATINAAEKTWSSVITLESGSNELIVVVEDASGNNNQFSTSAELDDIPPEITVSSSSLTNVSQFLLEGTYVEQESGLRKITVNGESANVIDGESWSKAVVLETGNNDFQVQIEDNAGNITNTPTSVFLSELDPVIKVTSASLTNMSEYIFEGEYIVAGDGVGIGINYIKVNDEKATISEDTNTWSHSVTLTNADNSFTLEMEDNAGNTTQMTTSVVLDVLPPTANLQAAISSRFSNDDGSYFSADLQLSNETPLYVEANKLSLSGMALDKESLITDNILFFAFDLFDQPLDGFETPLSELIVEYQYWINDIEIKSWEMISPNQETGELILPLVSELLSDAWYKTTVNDIHQLQIRVTDSAGNSAITQANFMAQFYVPELTPQISSENVSIGLADFSTRADYINQELDVSKFSLHNPLNRAIRIKLSDASEHSFEHMFETVNRIHKIKLVSTEAWRRSTLTPVTNICPDRNNDWQDLPEGFWNWQNGKWNPVERKVLIQVREFRSDIPPPVDPPSPWVDYETADEEEHSGEVIVGNAYIIDFNFDYITNYVEGEEIDQSQYGFINDWKIGEIIACPKITGIQTRDEYSYQAIAANEDPNGYTYPRNNMTETDRDVDFATTRFSVFAEDGTPLPAVNGWINVPANQTIGIVKYALTPDTTIYTDDLVRNSDSITDYDPHELDIELKWIIKQDILIDTQFNPDNILDDSESNKQQNFTFEDQAYSVFRD